MVIVKVVIIVINVLQVVIFGLLHALFVTQDVMVLVRVVIFVSHVM